MDEIGLNELLQLIIRDKGGSPQQYNQLMDDIAFHETGPVHPSVPDQRMKPDAVQYTYDAEKDKYVPDGTGRGLFMFESHLEKDPKTGELLSTGGNMASNYLAQILKKEGIEMPEWHRKVWAGKKTVDASKLTADQQKMLFLAYHRQHPKSNFSEYVSGELSEDKWWAKSHWAGTDDIPGHMDLFNKSMLAKDSLEARNIREEELFQIKDKVPFQSAENDINNLPSKDDILKGIFGAQDSSLIESDWDKGAKANPQSELWEGKPNPYRHAGAQVTTNPIELAVMGGGSLLKKLLLSPTDKSGIVDKGYTSKESGKKIFKKTAETLLKNVNKNPFMQQNLVNRVDEAKGKDLSKFQKFSDDMFLSRRFFQLFNPSK